MYSYKEAFANDEKPIQYGLIAEEVAEAFPDLVVYDAEGNPFTVKYHLLSSMLLNELQKQCQAQDARDEALEQELAELRDEVRELREELRELRRELRELRKELDGR